MNISERNNVTDRDSFMTEETWGSIYKEDLRISMPPLAAKSNI